MNSQWCPDSLPQLFGLFDLSIAPQLLFYTYLPVIAVSLFIGLYVLINDRYSLLAKLLFGISLSFTLWTVDIFFAWIAAYHSHVLFSWKLTPIIEVVMFLLAIWFVYVFIDEKQRDISIGKKALFLAMIFPVIIFTPTEFNIPYFDMVSCEGHPGVLWYYMYFLEVISILWIGIICTRKFFSEKDAAHKKRVLLVMVGMILFLLLFFASNVIGQYMEIQEISFFGSLGMLLFLGFLAYLIVKFQAFNIKLAGAQVLVVAQSILIASMLIFANSLINRILIMLTLAAVLGAGFFLIRSVKKEITRKDELQEMSDRLARANDELRKLDNAKSEFISIASHQLRTPLTAIKGFLSLILEGSYGKVAPEVQDVLNKVYASNDRIVQLVENLLNISRIESGRIQYQFQKSSIEDILKELSDMFFVMAKNKNLTLTFTLPKKKLPLLYMDAGKIREVISNLIDNAFKYTEKGRVEVILEQKGPVARITVSDTGMGIEAETMPHLFSKFIRGSKEASRMNVAGTGLGLYVGKSFIEAHHGRIWIESDGKGKGSRFIVELPIV